MSCPDWEGLVAHRRQPSAAEPAAWPAAIGHLRGCAACRRRAFAADPTLVFQLTPEPVPRPAEVEAMRQGVAALRNATRLRPGGAGRGARGPAIAAGRAAAAAGLLLLALSQTPSGPSGEATAGGGHPIAMPPELSLLPVVEDVNRPLARVYQLGSGDLEVVMIVDETLDV